MRMVRLLEIADQVRGVAYGKDDVIDHPVDGYVPVLRANNIQDDGLKLDDLVYVKSEKVSKKQFVGAGDIVIAASSGSISVVGKAAQADRDLGVGFGAFCKVVRPHEDVYDRYLGHFFKTSAYRQKMSKLAEGANINNLKNEHIDSLEIPLPPLEEQKRLAAILDQADDIRRKRQHAIDRLNHLGKAIFYEMFGDPNSPKNGYPLKNLGAVCAVSSGSTPSRANPDYYKGSIPWVKTGEVVGKRIFDTEEKITESAVENSSLKIYKIGTILIAMYGQGKTRGNVGILDIEAATNQACAALSCSVDIIPDFLFYQLKIGYEMIRSLGRGGNQPNLSAALVRDIPVIVPPREVQKDYVSRVLLAEAAIKSMNDQIDCNNNLFTSLQNRAFTGQL